MALASLTSSADTLTITTTELKTGSTSTTYVTTAFEFTAKAGKSSFKLKANQVNPSTGQIRVNNIGTSAFQMWNVDKIPNIKKVTLTADQSTIGTMYMKVSKTDEITDLATTSDIKGEGTDKTRTFTLPEGSSADYFHFNITAKGSGTVKLTKVEIEYVDPLSDAGLSFPAESYSANLGEVFESPVLTNPNNLDVTWISSDPGVATVDEHGTITLIGGGTTVINAASAATDKFKAGSASYTLKVTDPNRLEFTFDFKANDYGLTRSAAGSGYIKTDQTLTEGIVNLKLHDVEGNGFVLVENGGLRTYKGEVTMTFSLTNPDMYISEVTYSGASLSANGIVKETGWGNVNNTTHTQTWNGKKLELPVTLKPSDNKDINSITVKVAKREALMMQLVETGDEHNATIVNYEPNEYSTDGVIYIPAEALVNLEVSCPDGFDVADLNDQNLEILDNNFSELVVEQKGNKFEILAGNECWDANLRLNFKGGDNLVPLSNMTQYAVYIHPDLSKHFNFSVEELHAASSKAEGEEVSYVVKHPTHETTNAEGHYTYKYRVESGAQRVVRREGEAVVWNDYDHDAGIVLAEGTHTLYFNAERNDVMAPTPVQFTINTNQITTSVDSLEATAGETVYFDFTGRRLSQAPEKGIYLVKKGGVITKEIKN